MQLYEETMFREEKAVLYQILLPPFTVLTLLHKVMHLWEVKSAF